MTTQWLGSREEFEALIAAFRHQCEECAKGYVDSPLCPEHRAVLHDQAALDRLWHARRQASIHQGDEQHRSDEGDHCDEA